MQHGNSLTIGKPAGRISGFTLIELLVVISIIALLIAILLPSLAKARETARQVVCGTQERQTATALLGYSTDNKTWFPMVAGATSNVILGGAKESRAIAPYLGGEYGLEISKAVKKIVICPNTDSLLDRDDYAQLSSTRMGTTYFIVAARGDRGSTAVPTNPFEEYNATYTSWYGWIRNVNPAWTSGPYNGTYKRGPIPREQLLQVINNVAPSDQPMLSDIFFENATGSSALIYNGSTLIRSNHANGTNAAFLDGHVKFTHADSYKIHIQFYNSAATTRLRW